MMIVSVLNYLKADDELTTMLNHKRSHPKITAYKAHDINAYPYIVVESLTPYNLDILTGQYACSIRIVTDNELLIERLTTKVTDLLHFANRPSQKVNNNILFHSSHAGSGFLFDTEKNVFEQILNFNITFNR